MSIQASRIIRTQRRTLALMINSEAELIVRAPWRAPDDFIQSFVEKKQKWIERHIEVAKKRKAACRPNLYTEGERFLYLGQWRTLRIGTGAPAIDLEGDSLLLPEAFRAQARDRIINWYKAQALEIIQARVDWNANAFGFSVSGIKISGAAKRWGSCGPQNRLRFTWRLIMAPPDVIDYVVIHELCHIPVKNHSKLFWDKVKMILPDFKRQELWLRQNQQILEF